MIQLCREMFEHPPHIEHLLHAAHHREHHPEIAVDSRPEQGAQLRLQQVPPLMQTEPDSPQPEKRILFRRPVEVGVELVAADVKCAHNHRIVSAGDQKMLVHLELLLFVRRLDPVQKEVFRAEQTDPAGPAAFDLFDLFRRVEIGGKLDHEAVGGLRTERLFLFEFIVERPRCFGLQSIRLFGSGVRIDDDFSGVAVEDQFVGAQTVRQLRRNAHHRRQFHRTSQNRRVTGGAAGFHRETEHFALVELGGLRRREAVAHDDPTVIHPDLMVVRLGEVVHDPRRHVADVGSPFAQVFILHPAEDRGEVLRRLVESVVGRVVIFADSLLHGADEHLVIHQQQMCFEDVGILRIETGAEPFPQFGKLFPGDLLRRMKALQLGLHLFRGELVRFRLQQMAVSAQPQHPPDRNAGGDGDGLNRLGWLRHFFRPSSSQAGSTLLRRIRIRNIHRSVSRPLRRPARRRRGAAGCPFRPPSSATP